VRICFTIAKHTLACDRQWCVRVIFVESESSQSHRPFESESSQSHLKFFRVESQSESWLGRVESESSLENCRVTSSHWFASSSQCRVTRNSTFFLRHFFAMKLRPTCHKMAPDQLENGTQCCFNKFDCRFFISKFSQFAFYLSLSHSVIESIPTFLQVLQSLS